MNKLPEASSTKAGIVTTSAQTIAGAKSFTGLTTIGAASAVDVHVINGVISVKTTGNTNAFPSSGDTTAGLFLGNMTGGAQSAAVAGTGTGNQSPLYITGRVVTDTSGVDAAIVLVGQTTSNASLTVKNVLSIRNNTTEVGSVSASGTWTIGSASSGAVEHVIQGGGQTVLAVRAQTGTNINAFIVTDARGTGYSGIQMRKGGVNLGTMSTDATNAITWENSASNSVGAIAQGGGWTIGPGSGDVNHVFNGVIFANGTNTNGHRFYIPTGTADANEVMDLIRSGANNGSERYIRFYDGGSSASSLGTHRYSLRVNAGNTSMEFETVSDATLKQDIETLTGGLEKITSLRPVTFRWIENPQPDPSPGFIAQEVQSIFPKSVAELENGKLTLGTSEWLPYLVSAIKELKEENDQLKARLDAMDNE